MVSEPTANSLVLPHVWWPAMTAVPRGRMPALFVPIGVIPSVLADTDPGINSGPCGKFLGITVVFDLLAAAILASALWRPRERDPSSKGTLGTTAFLALWLGLAYGAFGIDRKST